jgi:hypothetical protein
MSEPGIRPCPTLREPAQMRSQPGCRALIVAVAGIDVWPRSGTANSLKTTRFLARAARLG